MKTKKDLGEFLQKQRILKGVSLNKMSKDLCGNRGQVSYLSNIEKGKIDITFSKLIELLSYFNLQIEAE